MQIDMSIEAISIRLNEEFGIDAAINGHVQRDHRLMVFLENSRMAVIATDDEGISMMRDERSVLQALGDRTSFEVPKILEVSDDASIDLRAPVIGNTDYGNIINQAEASPELALKIARNMADVLAELHDCLDHAEQLKLNLPITKWPPSTAWVRERLPEIVKDNGLLADMEDCLAVFDRLDIPAEDRVLCHGDFSFYNLVFEGPDHRINGVFDFADACYNERAWDLHLLVYGDSDQHYALLDESIQRYRDVSGQQIKRDRVLLYNAIIALTFMASRKGVPDDETWCGRTYEQDIAWTTRALSKLA